MDPVHQVTAPPRVGDGAVWGIQNRDTLSGASREGPGLTIPTLECGAAPDRQLNTTFSSCLRKRKLFCPTDCSELNPKRRGRAAGGRRPPPRAFVDSRRPPPVPARHRERAPGDRNLWVRAAQAPEDHTGLPAGGPGRLAGLVGSCRPGHGRRR